MPDSDLDTLMAHVAEINAKTPQALTDHDTDVLIAYHRHNRRRRADGYKPAKPERPKVDVLGMLGMAPTAAPKVTGTVRRT